LRYALTNCADVNVPPANAAFKSAIVAMIEEFDEQRL